MLLCFVVISGMYSVLLCVWLSERHAADMSIVVCVFFVVAGFFVALNQRDHKGNTTQRNTAQRSTAQQLTFHLPSCISGTVLMALF